MPVTDKDNSTPILNCERINLNFGRVMALREMSFEVKRGEIVSIIGPNGAGKTCIINTITGFYRLSRGHIHFKERKSPVFLLTRFAPGELQGPFRILNCSPA